MIKLKEIFKVKYLMYIMVSFSWVFLLTMVYELNQNLKDVYPKIHSIDQQLEEINDKLEYEYNSVDKGDYESIQHYRINKETGKIQTQNRWGTWSNW